MDYEKKYKEALKRAIQYKESGIIDEEYIDAIFGLSESEDEKIRKEIVECIETLVKQPGASPRLCDWIAWLEKQKEQKPLHWEPSEEEMTAFWNLMKCGVYLSAWKELRKPIESLYEDLLKLKKLPKEGGE